MTDEAQELVKQQSSRIVTVELERAYAAFNRTNQRWGLARLQSAVEAMTLQGLTAEDVALLIALYHGEKLSKKDVEQLLSVTPKRVEQLILRFSAKGWSHWRDRFLQITDLGVAELGDLTGSYFAMEEVNR